MKVAVLCEYSGIVRDAFLKHGHDAISCDILPAESRGPHIQGDLFDYDWSGYDLIIAHPPCTYLSNAGARHLYPQKKLNIDRYNLGLKAKKLFMHIYNMKNKKIVIENPIPSKIFELPKYDQIIQPYEYGHPFSKKTCLWIKGVDQLKPTNIIDNFQSTKIPGNWFNKGGKDRQKNRAKFWTGIAEAMADQWGCL